MTIEQNKLADRLHAAPDAEAFGSIAFAGRAEIIAALRAAGEPVAYRHKHFPNVPWQYRENATFGTPYPYYEPLYAAQPAPSASVREVIGIVDAAIERHTKSIESTRKDDALSETGRDRIIDQHDAARSSALNIKRSLAALSSTPSPLMAAGEAGGQDLMDRAARILNQATGGPEGWSQWDEAVMNVVREAADRLAALSSQPTRIDAAVRASETVEATSPAWPLRLCGYCQTWNSKPCGEQCHWSPADPTVPPQGAPAERDYAARVMGEPTHDQINAAAEVIWNDRDARHGGSWSSVDPNLIAAHQTIATARAALIAAANVTAAAEPARDMGVSVDPVESDQVRCGPMGEDDWKDQRIASLEAYIAQLKDQRAMAEPTREEIAAIIEPHAAGAIAHHGRGNASTQAVRDYDAALIKASAILALKPKGEPAQAPDAVKILEVKLAAETARADENSRSCREFVDRLNKIYGAVGATLRMEWLDGPALPPINGVKTRGQSIARRAIQLASEIRNADLSMLGQIVWSNKIIIIDGLNRLANASAAGDDEDASA